MSYRCHGCGDKKTGRPNRLVTQRRSLPGGGSQIVRERDVCDECVEALGVRDQVERRAS